MKATASLAHAASELQALEEARRAHTGAFEERFLPRIKHQRKAIGRVLDKLNHKNSQRDYEDYCWPERYQWAAGVGALRVVGITPQAFELEVTRKGGAKTTYWVRHDVLFVSDWGLAKQVRRELAKSLQAQRMERLRKLHQKCQEQALMLERLRGESAKTRQQWEELKKRTEAPRPRRGASAQPRAS